MKGGGKAPAREKTAPLPRPLPPRAARPRPESSGKTAPPAPQRLERPPAAQLTCPIQTAALNTSEP